MDKETTKRPVMNEVATVEKDIDLFYGWQGRMENPDQLLREESGGRGVRIYEELIRDWQVFSMLQTRALSLQGFEWQVEPATEKRADVKVADFVESVFKECNFDRLCRQLMQAVITGYKPVEVMWEVSEDDIWIKEFRGRRPSRFVFDDQDNLRLLTRANMWDGEPVPDRKFITWSYGGHDHNPYGLGLGHQLYWPVWFKKNGIRFWMIFVEQFGAPTPVGKYPPGATEKEKSTLLEAVTVIRQQTGVTIPETMLIELLEAKRTGDGSYEAACNYFDDCISKIILGQTLTSDQGERGSQALGNVHERVMQSIVNADADDQCECINRSVVRWLVDYNFPMQGRTGYPKVWRRTEPEQNLKELAERDKILLVDMGLRSRVPESYIEETYGIQMAKEGERTIGDGMPQGDPTETQGRKEPKPPDDTGAGAAELSEPRFTPDQQAIERMVEETLPAGIDAMDDYTGRLMDVIRESRDPDDLAGRLAEIFGRMLDEHALTNVIQQATVAADMYGRFTAREEA